MIYERVIRSAVYLLGSRAVLPLLNVLATVLVAHWLNPEHYALMALGVTFGGMVGLVCELGLGAAIVQFQDTRDEELNTAFWLTLGLASSAYIALYAAAPFIARFFASIELTQVLRVMGLPAMLTVIRLVPESLLRKQLRLDLLSIAEVVATLTAIPLMVVLAWSGAGVWSLVSGSAANSIVQSVLLFAFSGWRPRRLVGSSRLGGLLRYGGAVMGSRVLWSMYSASDRLILSRMAGDVSLGFYAMATQIALIPLEKVSVVLNQLSAPVFAEVQGNLAVMRSYLARSLRIVAWITLPMSVGTLLIAKDVIRIALTEKWSPAAPIVQVLCVSACVRSLTVLFPPVLIAFYRADFLVRYNLVMAAVMPLGFAGGAWWSGGLGVATVWALIYPVGGLVVAGVALRHLKMSWRALVSELRGPALATTFMAIATIGASHAASALGAHAGGRFAIAVVVGIAAYGMAFWYFGTLELDELTSIFRTMRSPTVSRPDSARTVR